MKTQKYSPEKLNDHYDVIIIGSGISGLCSAALLSMEGKKVLLLEKHFKVGGYTHTFKRNNYEWDVGIHYIGAVHLKKTLLSKIFSKITEDNLIWNKMSDNYDRIIFPDRNYDFVAPKSRFIEDMKAYFPLESSNIDQYVEVVSKVNKSMLKYFSAKALSGIPELLLYKNYTKEFLSYSDKTTYQALSEITSNEQLIGVLTGQWGDYGLPPKESSFVMHCMIAGHYFDGANYPVGGSRMIAENIVPVIEKNGGQIFVSTGVDKIYIKNGKCGGVILENGDTIESTTVISSAGIQNTLGTFLRDEISLDSYNRNLSKVKPSFGYGCLYVGFEQNAKALGIENTNQWIYPSYDHDLNTSTYMNNENAPFPETYISFASSKHPPSPSS